MYEYVFPNAICRHQCHLAKYGQNKKTLRVASCRVANKSGPVSQKRFAIYFFVCTRALE